MNSCCAADITCCAESFYVKPLATWIPYLLMPNFVPVCQHGQKKGGVDVTNAAFVVNPKILCWVGSHHSFDACQHQCSGSVEHWDEHMGPLDCQSVHTTERSPMQETLA